MRRPDTAVHDAVRDVASEGATIGSDRGVRGRLAAAPQPQAVRGPRASGGALILHDDLATLTLLRSVVESAGFDALCPRTVFDVAAADVTESTRLVVLGLTSVDDREMEIVSLLRRRSPQAWILVLFPASLRERAAKALALGADASLPEPFYASELTAIASRATVRSASAPTPAPAPETPPAPAPPAVDAPAVDAQAGRGPSVVVERLAAGVAHSIRNPLQIIELQLGAAETDGEVDVAGMRAELRRIAGVVDGLTRLAGGQGLTLRPTDLTNLVTGVFVSRDVGAAGAEIGVRIGEARVEVLAAPELLRAGLESLRNRAVRVTPPEGKISVRTRSRVDDGRPMVEISVTDGGPALTDEQRAHLFDPFPDEQSVLDGTGLEVAALAGIVRDHRGVVFALSAGATGTIIVIRLPVGGDAAQPHEPVTT